MDRRAMLGMLGAGAVGVAVTGREAAAADEKHMHDKVHDDCLKACADGARACDETFHHCVMEVAAGKKEHARSVQLLSDCAGFCALSACMIAKHSPLMAYSCMACAEACKSTVAEIAKFDSEEMKVAAQALRTCEKSCLAMVDSMKSHHGAHDAAEKRPIR